jgi:hypothetical protein
MSMSMLKLVFELSMDNAYVAIFVRPDTVYIVFTAIELA